MPSVPECSFDELAWLSRQGRLAEVFGVALGCPAIIVHDVKDPTANGQLKGRAQLMRDIASLPCVIVCHPGAFELTDFVDVILNDASFDHVMATIHDFPLASTALAMVLRGAAARTTDAGLVAESTTYSMLQAGPEFAAWRAGRRPAHHTPHHDHPVLTDRVGNVVTVTLNRPDCHNAYSAAMRDGVVEALLLAQLDESVRLIIRGQGPSFCSGGDLQEFGSFSDPVSSHAVRLARSAGRLMARLAERVTVQLHGACIGSGIELAAFAGRVEAHESSQIGLPELGMGLIPGAGGTVSLPGRIGRHRTALLALSRQTIDASTALAWGLVDAIVSP